MGRKVREVEGKASATGLASRIHCKNSVSRTACGEIESERLTFSEKASVSVTMAPS